MSNFLLSLAAVLAACAPVTQNDKGTVTESGADEILIRSVPTDGASVSAPQSLSLTFREPARLVELIISGPAGEMPMMVTAAGEQISYSIPLPEMEPGLHEVRWRALAGGVPQEGRLSFTVR